MANTKKEVLFAHSDEEIIAFVTVKLGLSGMANIEVKVDRGHGNLSDGIIISKEGSDDIDLQALDALVKETGLMLHLSYPEFNNGNPYLSLS